MSVSFSQGQSSGIPPLAKDSDVGHKLATGIETIILPKLQERIKEGTASEQTRDMVDTASIVTFMLGRPAINEDIATIRAGCLRFLPQDQLESLKKQIGKIKTNENTARISAIFDTAISGAQNAAIEKALRDAKQAFLAAKSEEKPTGWLSAATLGYLNDIFGKITQFLAPQEAPESPSLYPRIKPPISKDLRYVSTWKRVVEPTKAASPESSPKLSERKVVQKPAAAEAAEPAVAQAKPERERSQTKSAREFLQEEYPIEYIFGMMGDDLESPELFLEQMVREGRARASVQQAAKPAAVDLKALLGEVWAPESASLNKLMGGRLAQVYHKFNTIIDVRGYFSKNPQVATALIQYILNSTDDQEIGARYKKMMEKLQSRGNRGEGIDDLHLDHLPGKLFGDSKKHKAAPSDHLGRFFLKPLYDAYTQQA